MEDFKQAMFDARKQVETLSTEIELVAELYPSTLT
jgi:hypothetical protein